MSDDERSAVTTTIGAGGSARQAASSVYSLTGQCGGDLADGFEEPWVLAAVIGVIRRSVKSTHDGD